jgi:hypothetical protein
LELRFLHKFCLSIQSSQFCSQFIGLLQMTSQKLLNYLNRLYNAANKAVNDVQHEEDKKELKIRNQRLLQSLLHAKHELMLIESRSFTGELNRKQQLDYETYCGQWSSAGETEQSLELKSIQNKLEALGKLDERKLGAIYEKLSLSPAFQSESVQISPVISGQAWLLTNLLSSAECSQLILATSGAMLLAELHCYAVIARNNERCVIVDENVARILYERIEPFCPATIERDGDEWEICAVNELIRFCRYGVGQYFGVHVDEMYKFNEEKCSFLTCMIYLNSQLEKADSLLQEENSSYTGGSTVFLDKEYFPELEVKPSAGNCLLFYQGQPYNLLHEGEVVTSGIKYIMRTDIVYSKKRRAATAASSETGNQK